MRPNRATPRRVAAALATALVLGACSQTSGDVAAVVNGTEISLDLIRTVVAGEQARLVEAGATASERAAQLQALQSDLLTTFIRIEIREQEARRLGVVVTDEDVEAEWQNQIAVFGSEQALRDRLDELGLSEDQARRQLLSNLLDAGLRDAIIDSIEVTDADVEALYVSLGDRWTTRSASHIMLNSVEEAQAVLDLVLADPSQWDALAEERSIDPSTAALGGQLGAQPRNTYPFQTFEDAIWLNEVGDIVGPIETQAGFHVVRIDEEETRTLEDVREQLSEQIRGQRFDEALGNLEARLNQEADVVVDARFGSWDELAGAVVPGGPLDS